MRTLKSVFGISQALVPVLYCGGLVYYFFGVGGSVEGVQTIGLGPTVVGLAAVGLLFCIPLILKIRRLFDKPRAPGAGGGPDTSPRDDDDGFDPDAVIARYMARQSAEAAASAPAARAANQGGPGKRPGFGRRIS
jgi:hypothetical protein